MGDGAHVRPPQPVRMMTPEERVQAILDRVNSAIQSCEEIAQILEDALSQHVYTFDADDPDGNKERAEYVDRRIKQALKILRG